MSKNHTSLSLSEYLTVSDAAEVLGVSSGTLRNWDRTGKLKPQRHPLNGYRLYKRSELETLLHQTFNSQSSQCGLETA